MSERTVRECDECHKAPRRLAMEMDGRLFCQRACYLAWCGKIWDREFAEMWSKPQKSNVIPMAKKAKV